ncbi:outer membrane biogenesis protein BamB [Rubripirellula tenax]|uniref:Outer membrane biogenesis protein BamB n=1 Tax=Rubripirellula tenax TaxID=2528015 RepID=A0A5C6FKJ3_9BACT|nr:PQQ-binding-like beta-propeller repeat protein [Rubripirellula tenax]TWU60294.1 outer membrane biogenesis protein BamB [Rubripirellula tenax]
MHLSRFVACVLFAGWVVPHVVAQEWNQWRGPSRDAQWAGSSFPTKLTGNLKQVWEQPHAQSYSGPVIRGDLVYTTETVDKTDERVTAHRLDTGDVAWTATWPGAMAVPFFAASNGDWIRATPICDAEHLIVLGMRDVLVSLDPTTGDEQWRVDFPAQLGTPLPSFGAVCSPLIDEGFVYVQTGGALVKLSVTDGAVVWKTLENAEGMMSSGAFSSPTIATLGGQKQLVVQTREELCGVDLATGQPLWREKIEAFRGMNILTPTVIGDRIFTSAHSGRAQLFSVSKAAGGDWVVDEIWSQKTQAYMSSPVVIDDTIYLHAKNQRLIALSIEDGSIRWTSEPFGKYWSMIAAGDRMLALDETGELLLISANTEKLEIIDRTQVADNAWAHLAIHGNRLIVRDLSALKVYEFDE